MLVEGIYTNTDNKQNRNNPEHFGFEVSLLVIQYNASFSRIKKTLESILHQEKIHYEIIITDDGSKNNYADEIKELFNNYCFTDYKLVMNPINRGTVSNYNSGLAVVEGEYIKCISPGDCLYDNSTLKGWVDFIRSSGKEWSFSDAVYYDADTGNKVSSLAHPQIIEPFISGKEKDMRWNYLVLRDIALGAAMISSAKIQRVYCERIEKAGVVFAEDNMWRLMMFDGVVPAFYSKPTILYEFGHGISTGSDMIWRQRLAADWEKTDDIMKRVENPDGFQKKILKHMKAERNIFKKILTKGKIKQKLIQTLHPRMTEE